jgi:uncharacterized protein (TIGR02996 family)
MTKDEWAFIAACVAKPADAAIRLIYADWLDDRGLTKRANRQREIAAVIDRAVEMWKLPPPHTSGAFGVIINRKGRRSVFRLKRDGEIHWFAPHRRYVLFSLVGVGYRIK